MILRRKAKPRLRRPVQLTLDALWGDPDALGPEPRIYRLNLPWKTPPLSLNRDLHRMAEARIAGRIRAHVGWMARQARIPRAEHCTVTLVWAPGDNGRRDTDNPVPTLKHACDGLVDAGIVPDDTPRWMTKNEVRILTGPSRPRGLWLEIEVE